MTARVAARSPRPRMDRLSTAPVPGHAHRTASVRRPRPTPTLEQLTHRAPHRATYSPAFEPDPYYEETSDAIRRLRANTALGFLPQTRPVRRCRGNLRRRQPSRRKHPPQRDQRPLCRPPRPGQASKLRTFHAAPESRLARPSCLPSLNLLRRGDWSLALAHATAPHRQCPLIRASVPYRLDLQKPDAGMMRPGCSLSTGPVEFRALNERFGS
jgi:hypothetical protein